MGNCVFGKKMPDVIYTKNEKNMPEMHRRDKIAFLIFDIISSPIEVTHTELLIGDKIWGYGGGCSMGTNDSTGIYNYTWNSINVGSLSIKNPNYKLKKIIIFYGSYNTFKFNLILEHIKDKNEIWRKSDYNFVTYNCNCFTKTILYYINPKFNDYFSQDLTLRMAINKNNIIL
jgi:hypothetical protein